MYVYIIWLIFGVVCFFIEAMVSGFGFLFAGLGALTAGSVLAATPDISYLTQWLVFFISSVIWWIILWKPLAKFRASSSNSYKNIVGDVAFIAESGLKKGEIGEAKWSGTIMKAKLADDVNIDNLAGGAQVIIVALSQNILIVKPKT